MLKISSHIGCNNWKLIRSVILFFILFPISVMAQPPLKESLSKLRVQARVHPDRALNSLDSLMNIKNDFTLKERTRILNLQALCYYYKNDFPTSIRYYQKALRNSKILKDSVFVNQLYYNIGLMDYEYGNFERSLNYYDSSYQILNARNDTVEIGYLYFNIGNTYNRKGFYVTAIKYYYKSLKKLKNSDNIRQKGMIFSNIGTCQLQSDLYTKADSNFHKALKLYRSIDYKQGELLTLNNLGVIQINTKNYDKAKQIFLRLLERTKKDKDSVNMGSAMNNLGQIALKSNQWLLAKHYFEEAMFIFKTNNLNSEWVDVHNYWAITLCELGKFRKGLKILDSNFQYVVRKDNIPLVIEYGRKYSYYLQKSGNLSESNKIMNHVLDAEEKIAIQKRRLLFSDLETKYNIERNKNLLQLSKNIEKVDQLKVHIQKINYRLYLLGTISLCILLFGVIFFISFRGKQKNKAIKFKLDSRDKELTHYAMYVSEKNKFLKSLAKEFKAIKDAPKYKKIYTSLTRHIQSTNSEAIALGNEANKFYRPIITALRENFKDVTNKDIRLCNLILLDFSSKDISTVFNISPKSVDMHRYRLRKKLGIKSNQSIKSWLEKQNTKL